MMLFPFEVLSSKFKQLVTVWLSDFVPILWKHQWRHARTNIKWRKYDGHWNRERLCKEMFSIRFCLTSITNLFQCYMIVVASLHLCWSWRLRSNVFACKKASTHRDAIDYQMNFIDADRVLQLIELRRMDLWSYDSFLSWNIWKWHVICYVMLFWKLSFRLNMQKF